MSAREKRSRRDESHETRSVTPVIADKERPISNSDCTKTVRHVKKLLKSLRKRSSLKKKVLMKEVSLFIHVHLDGLFHNCSGDLVVIIVCVINYSVEEN